MSQQEKDEARVEALRREHEALAARLAGIGFIWPGTIVWRMMTCGRSYCRCMTDSKARHGPYPSWTVKKAQKTVTKILSPEEAALLEQWIANRRELDRIVKQMKKLSSRAAKAALRLRAKKDQHSSGD